LVDFDDFGFDDYLSFLDCKTVCHFFPGKTTTMVGSCSEDIGTGLMPTAIAWLFRGIGEQKNKTGARFSVRVSAVEIAGPAEVLRDLLAPHATGKLVLCVAFILFLLSPIKLYMPF
jgi:hypothetical protein